MLNKAVIAALATLVGLLAGLGLGTIIGPQISGRRIGPPVAVYKGQAPSETETNIARDMLVSAQEELKAGRVSAARESLVSCIELANLPACHRVLGTMLGLTQDPSAEAHLLKYLELSEPTPDAALVRETLDKSGS